MLICMRVRSRAPSKATTKGASSAPRSLWLRSTLTSRRERAGQPLADGIQRRVKPPSPFRNLEATRCQQAEVYFFPVEVHTWREFEKLLKQSTLDFSSTLAVYANSQAGGGICGCRVEKKIKKMHRSLACHGLVFIPITFATPPMGGGTTLGCWHKPEASKKNIKCFF